MDIKIHKVKQDGITYYMTDEEYKHKDEWVQAIKDEIKLREQSWQMRKKELYEKWHKEG